MADHELAALEHFLTSHSLSAFTPGTELSYYFSLLSLLQEPLGPAFADLLKKFEGAHPTSALVERVKLREVLKRYEEAKDEAGKAECLARLNQTYLHFTFDVPVLTASSEASCAYPTALDPSLLALDLTRASSDLSYFQSLSHHEYALLNTSLLVDSVFIEFLSRADIHRYPGIVPRLATLIETVPCTVKSVEKLTLEQIRGLVELKPMLMNREEVVAALFVRQFQIPAEASDREKVEVLREALAWANGLADKFGAYKKQLMFDILTLSAKLGEYPEELFIDYLRQHGTGKLFISKDTLQPCEVPIALFRQHTEEALISIYLENLLPTKDDFSLFSPYLSPTYLSTQFSRAKILSGSDPISFPLPPLELNALANEVILEFAPGNPRIFPRAADVSLTLSTKNVVTLILKVTELNPLAYSLAHLKPVPDTIDLNGLEATYQEVIDCSEEEKCVKNVRNVTVLGLSGKAGLFAVDVFGNGLHARALIKKGHLKLVSKVTPAGLQMTVLNETNEVCVGEGAGIYIDSRLYELKPENQTVIIPFSGVERTNVAVITDGVISDCVPFLHRKETYELRCGFVVLEESLQAGESASVSVFPTLFVTGLPGPKELMEELKLAIVTVDIDGISSSKKYPQVTFPANEDMLTVEFEVPTKTLSLTIEFSCEVKTINEPKLLTATRTFRVNETSTSMACKQLFLRKCDGDYYVQILGKNGEPCAKQVVSMGFKIWERRTVSNCLLSSGEDGLIRLGDLGSVSTLWASILEDGINSGVENSWSLESFRPAVQYPSMLILCEGDSYGLPFARIQDKTAPLSQFEAELEVRDSKNRVISVSTSSLKYDLETEMILISGLSAGHYLLRLGSDAIVSVEVHKGIHWGNNQFILTDTAVIPTQKQYRSLMISSVSHSKTVLSVSLAGDYNDATVHIFFHTFLSHSARDTYKSIVDMKHIRASEPISNPEFHSVFTKSETIEKEYRYVLERTLQEKFTGNNLPKPQLLLKPTITQEVQSECFSDGCSMECREMCCCDDEDEEVESERKQKRRPSSICKKTNCMEFLKYPAVAKLCCPVAADGTVSILLPEGSFSLVSILAVNSDSTAFLISDLHTLAFETKDLSLRKPLNPAKTYAETRQTSVIHTGEVLTIPDIATASLQIIDSIDKLAQLLSQISKRFESDLSVAEWDFLGRWYLLSDDEKQKKYEKYCSHELNLFLHFKDPLYFAAVVRPLLASKLEKDLVDRYLLGESLEDYVRPEIIKKLNYLELALLASRYKEGLNLSEMITNQAKAIPNDDCYEQQLFDAVLKFSIEGANADDLKAFQSEENRAAINESEAQSYNEMCEAKSPNLQIGDTEISCELLGVSEDDQISDEKMSSPRSETSPSFEVIPQNQKLMLQTTERAAISDHEKHISRVRMSTSSCASEAEIDFEGFEDSTAEQILSQREALRPYFKQMDSTKEYAETHYFGLKDSAEFSSRVPLSKYWADLTLAASSGSLTCLTPSVLSAIANLTTYIAALTFSDLPLQAGKHRFISHGQGVQITAGTNFLAFHKSTAEVRSTLQERILCVQRFFHVKERYTKNAAGEEEEKLVREFVAGVVYGSQVIVTNALTDFQQIHVLVQVPEGAIPVSTFDYTKSHLMQLRSYETKSIENYFYFPVAGEYLQAPVNVSANGEVVCVSASSKLKVSAMQSVSSSDSLKEIAATGDADLAVTFLQIHNPHSLDTNSQLSSLLWMLTDKAKYEKLIAALREQQFFYREAWAYSFLHRDEQAIKELLATEEHIKDVAGAYLRSLLLTTDSGQVRHLDYSPMVNARAYRLASQPRIVSEQFKSAYYRFLFTLAHKTALDSADYLAFIQYLLYQDRIPEAKRLIPKVGLQPSEGSPGSAALQLQFDYLVCYLDAKVGQTVAPLYAHYPIPMWRNLFALVSEQFEDEEEDKTAEKEALSASLSFTVEHGRIQLLYQNLTEVTIRLYEIDIEVLFSTNPFFMKDTELFTYVCPNATFQVRLNPKQFEHVLELEGNWAHSNSFVEVEYDGKKLFKAYYSSSLTIQLIEQYGLVHILDSSDHGVPRAYVKVFSLEKTGQVSFYKDGYTDIRGKFDYASLTTNQLEKVKLFAMLVAQDKMGATVVMANPPVQ